MIELATSTAIDHLDDFDALDRVINDLGDGMSKAAGEFIAAQMAAEKYEKRSYPHSLRPFMQHFSKAAMEAV